MPLESFPKGFLLKKQESVNALEEEPIEEPVEQEPEPLPAPSIPINPTIKTYETSTKITAWWEFPEEMTGISFVLFFDGNQHSTLFEKTTVDIIDLSVGIHTFAVKAINDEGTESAFTNEVSFEIKKPAGIDNANYWLPFRIDNIAVTYRK